MVVQTLCTSLRNSDKNGTFQRMLEHKRKLISGSPCSLMFQDPEPAGYFPL